VVVVVVIATQLGGSGADVMSSGPGVFHDPPFTVRLDGPLWWGRTLHDNDGAQDFALIESDLPLDVRVTGDSSARVAELELRVDGRRSRVVVPRCPGGRCPVSTSVRFVPPLRALRPGQHQVEILVRDPGGQVGMGGRFSVRTVRNVPRTFEGRTISKAPAPAPPAQGVARLRGPALSVLAAERKSGGIAVALGSSRVPVMQVGRLDAPGRQLGVTMLVAVTPPRYGVSAILPAYVPVVDPSGRVRYRIQEVQMEVAVLRDVLIDVDLVTRKVISFEPGPGSRTLTWSPSKAPVPAGAADED
jgi:hypothetical protein